MTNRDAIKFLSSLPPDGVAPLRYVFEAAEEADAIRIGARIGITFLSHGSSANFLIGRDVVITIDGRELDFALIASATLRMLPMKPVELDLALVPTWKVSEAHSGSPDVNGTVREKTVPSLRRSKETAPDA